MIYTMFKTAAGKKFIAMSENDEIKTEEKISENITNAYTTFEGRLNRLAFCVMGLKAFAVFIVVCVAAGFLFGVSEIAGYILTGCAIIAITICNISLSVRRLHDLNRSGWWVILLFIPWVDLVAGLYVIFAPGTVGKNDYGDDPLEQSQ